MKSRHLQGLFLFGAFLLLPITGCSPTTVVGPTPTPSHLKNLLIDLSSFPSGWEVYLPATPDPESTVDNLLITFRPVDSRYNDLAQHGVYLFPDEPSAEQAWKSESRGFDAMRVTSWKTPDTFPYKSKVADQFRFFCADFEVPDGGIRTLCLAVARYGRCVSIFSTWPSNHMTWMDIERILQDIDCRMAKQLDTESR